MTDEITVPEPAEGSDAPAVTTTAAQPADAGAPPVADELVSTTPPARKSNRRLAIIITIVVIVVVGGAAAAVTTFLLRTAAAISTPTPYVSQSYGFKVTMPGKPKVTSRTTDSGDSAQSVVWSGLGGQSVTIETEKASAVIPTSRYSAVLTAGLAASASSVADSNPTNDTKFTLDGQPAESENLKSTTAGSFYEVITVKGAYVYVIVIGHPTASLDKSVVNSFKFLN